VQANIVDMQVAEKMARIMTLDPHIQLSVDPNTKGVITMWEYMQACEYIQSDADPKSFIDTSLYQEALAKVKSEEPDNPYWAEVEKRFQDWN
jgi:hypothetical protein